MSESSQSDKMPNQSSNICPPDSLHPRTEIHFRGDAATDNSNGIMSPVLKAQVRAELNTP
jgi:hypothetical protein